MTPEQLTVLKKIYTIDKEAAIWLGEEIEAIDKLEEEGIEIEIEDLYFSKTATQLKELMVWFWTPQGYTYWNDINKLYERKYLL